ncbi:hypothetical protein K2X30_13200 [bacterium]|nr:hypothetical protein [bacterium]
MNFVQKKLDGYFFTAKGFYIFFIPIFVPYHKIYGKAKEVAGFKLKQDFGPILESGKLFGLGWIGVEVEKASGARHVQGTFKMYEHKGPYQELGRVYKEVMKDCSKKAESFNLYLDDGSKLFLVEIVA